MTPDNALMTTAPTDSQPPLQQLACARCGASFECGAAAGACWCMEETYRLPLPETAAADCLCPACLRVAAAKAGLPA